MSVTGWLHGRGHTSYVRAFLLCTFVKAFQRRSSIFFPLCPILSIGGDTMTTADLIIRDARTDERNAIRDLALVAYQQYAQVMPAPAWAGYRQNIVATLEGANVSEQIVAEREGCLVGSVSLYLSAGDAYGRAESQMPWPIIRL